MAVADNEMEYDSKQELYLVTGIPLSQAGADHRMRTLVGVTAPNKGDWGASGAEASVVKPTLGLAGDVPISLWAATRKLY